jgi:hypothetical protein
MAALSSRNLTLFSTAKSSKNITSLTVKCTSHVRPCQQTGGYATAGRGAPSVTSTISGGRRAERHDAAAEAAGDHDVAVHADVTIGELLSRRRDRRPAEHAHLAAMGMAGELQRDARRHAPRDVGLVRQQNDRRVVGDFRQRRAEIVDADPLERPEARAGI